MDLFAGIDGLGAAPAKKISLAEQRRIQENNNRKTVEAFEGLDLLSASSSSSNLGSSHISSSNNNTPAPQEEEDLFGIFNSAPAPKPQAHQHTAERGPERKESHAQPVRQVPRESPIQAPLTEERDNDLWESDELPQRASRSMASRSTGARSTASNPPASRTPHQRSTVSDLSVAQLVDMGFEASDAQRALEAMNGSVRGAVSWLMAEAQGLPLPKPSKPGLTSTLANGDFSDLQTAASNIGASMFSKASSLFTKGRKELEKAYNQYNHQYSGDPSEPAWMRDKAKYDARRNLATSGTDMELPPRPRPREQRDRDSEPQQQSGRFSESSDRTERADRPAPQGREKPSRAELFRQRQRERNQGSPAVSASKVQAAPQDSLVNIDPASATSSAAMSTTPSFTPESTPEIDLLNISGKYDSMSSSYAALSSTERDLYKTSRELGTESFRKGDYEGAVEHYTAAMQVVPETNVLRALLLSNRSAAYIKAGNLRGAFDDTTVGISLLPNQGKGLEVDEKGVVMSDIWVKLVTRNAQAAENMEKFEDALKSWQLLLDNGYATSTVLEAKRRCLKALNPEAVAKQNSSTPPASSTNGAAKKSQRRGWGTTGAMPTSAEGKAALEKVKANHDKLMEEERQKDLLRDKVTQRVESWKKGNEANLRALLSTMQNVLWDSCDWTPVSLSDLVIPKKVRIVYMKAVARTHPDKVPASAPIEVRMISQSVFVIIQHAWEIFRQENGL